MSRKKSTKKVTLTSVKKPVKMGRKRKVKTDFQSASLTRAKKNKINQIVAREKNQRPMDIIVRLGSKKETPKIVAKKKKFFSKILLLVLVFCLSGVFGGFLAFSVRKITEEISQIVHQEQAEYLVFLADWKKQLEMELAKSESIIQTTVIEKKQRLTLEQKKELSDLDLSLAKLAIRAEQKMTDYRADQSIQLWPYRDRTMETVVNSAWFLPVMVNRFSQSTEKLIWSSNITDDQLALWEKDLRYLKNELAKK